MLGTLYGKAHKFGDNINTDYIMASRHRAKSLDYKELAQYLMEDIRPNFYKNFNKGDFIVAGENFGCGSSREYAARILKEGGCNAVVSSSFARIFYRNAINVGLIPIECSTDLIDEGDQLEVDIETGYIRIINKEIKLSIKPIPSFVQDIILAGGLVNLLKEQ
ncbi:MAG: 3-isopropylmalate dehydratase [Mahellales bacterium]|jgi:3-isopropylmalate/(R)-2-methylmalate dehydratase small subunit